MKKNCIAKGMFVFLLTAHLLMAQGAMNSFVLCIGVDGHVNYEFTADQLTCSSFTAPGSEPENSTIIPPHKFSPTDHCGDCEDVTESPQLKQMVKRHSGSAKYQVFQPQNRAEFPSPLKFGVFSTGNYPVRQIGPETSPFNSHGTVILLI